MAEELPPDSAEATDSYFDTYTKLTGARTDFLDAARRYSRIPIDSLYYDFTLAKAEMQAAFEDCADIIIKTDAELHEMRSLIVDLIVSEDKKRVDALNLIAGNGVCKVMSEKEVQMLLQSGFSQSVESVGSYAEPIDDENLEEEPIEDVHPATNFINYYKAGVDHDFGGFVAYTISRNRTKVVELGKSAGKYAADIGKIAAGVSLGIYLIRRSNS